MGDEKDRAIVLGDTEVGNQSQLCFILSKGCLESEDFFKQLVRGAQAKSVLPVAACKDFEFPDDFDLQCAADAYDNSDAALPILQALFKIIAVEVNFHGSDTLIRSQVAMMRERLTSQQSRMDSDKSLASRGSIRLKSMLFKEQAKC